MIKYSKSVSMLIMASGDQSGRLQLEVHETTAKVWIFFNLEAGAEPIQLEIESQSALIPMNGSVIQTVLIPN